MSYGVATYLDIGSTSFTLTQNKVAHDNASLKNNSEKNVATFVNLFLASFGMIAEYYTQDMYFLTTNNQKTFHHKQNKLKQIVMLDSNLNLQIYRISYT
jgi:hypothetical protein